MRSAMLCTDPSHHRRRARRAPAVVAAMCLALLACSDAGGSGAGAVFGAPPMEPPAGDVGGIGGPDDGGGLVDGAAANLDDTGAGGLADATHDAGVTAPPDAADDAGGAPLTDAGHAFDTSGGGPGDAPAYDGASDTESGGDAGEPGADAQTDASPEDVQSPCSETSCDDDNPCTVDICGAAGCVHTPVGCDDGNPCTADGCGAAGCIHAPLDCDDGTACTVDGCDASGCVHALIDCSDGDPCTNDSCDATGCVHGPVDCNDGDPCTADLCGAGGCASTPVKCNDGDPCTLDSCAAGSCKHKPKCSDGDPCTTDLCDTGTGACGFTPFDCDDGDPCTADACATGTCTHTLAPPCGAPAHLEFAMMSNTVSKSDLHTVRWHPSGAFALILGSTGDVLRYDGDTGALSLVANLGSVLDLDVHPSGGWFLIVGRDQAEVSRVWRASVAPDLSLTVAEDTELDGGMPAAVAWTGWEDTFVIGSRNDSASSQLNSLTLWRDGQGPQVVMFQGNGLVDLMVGTPSKFLGEPTVLTSNGVNGSGCAAYVLTSGEFAASGWSNAFGNPGAAAWRPGGSYGMFTAWTAGKLYVFDGEAWTAEALPNTPSGAGPNGIGWKPDGTRALIVGNALGAPLRAVVVDYFPGAVDSFSPSALADASITGWDAPPYSLNSNADLLDVDWRPGGSCSEGLIVGSDPGSSFSPGYGVALRFWDANDPACAPCGNASPCGPGTTCVAGSCLTCGVADPQHCGTSCAICSGTTPTCAGGSCVCTGSSCGAGAKCQGGTCTACATASACGASCLPCAGATPYCAANGSGCVQCATDAQCAPGSACEGGVCIDGCGDACCVGDPTPSGNTCAAAIVVGRAEAAAGAVYQGDTTSAGNNDDLSSSLGSACWDAKYDQAYRLWVLEGEALSVALSPTTPGFDAMLKLYSGTACADGGTGLVGCFQSTGDGGAEGFDWVATGTGWVTIVVDGRMAFAEDHDFGTYSLSLSLTCDQPGCGCP